MTKERMICELELVWSNIGPSYKWMPVDEAPPKDWRPACWTGDFDDDFNYCRDPSKDEPCKSCPFRK